MTTFFIPGVGSDSHVLEDAYRDMGGVIELELGRQPTTRRIQRLWTRRGNVDCITEVGRSDPLRGGTVVAIFDMGPNQPFVVWWHANTGGHVDVREILGCHAYAVLEFDS